MSDPLLWHRLQFAFTIVYHYLFPAADDGAGAAHRRDEGARPRAPATRRWDDAARFWIRIFGINFAVGVVTGIPMEFQFGTNWARFSRYAGGVIGQTLAMEGMFAFFLESSFLGAARVRRAAARRRGHFLAAAGALRRQLALGLLHHLRPTRSCSIRSGHASRADGTLQLGDFWAFLLNPWALAQYAHTMVASVVTAVVRGGGRRRLLRAPGPASPIRRARFLRVGVVGGARVERARRVPDRRPPGEARGAASAGGAGRDGGTFRERARRRHRR